MPIKSEKSGTRSCRRTGIQPADALSIPGLLAIGFLLLGGNAGADLALALLPVTLLVWALGRGWFVGDRLVDVLIALVDRLLVKRRRLRSLLPQVEQRQFVRVANRMGAGSVCWRGPPVTVRA